jgi:hypothetical protein
MKQFFIALIFTGILSAQTVTVSLGNLTLPNEAAAAYESWRMTQITGPALTLTAAINATVTTFALIGDATGFIAGDQITVDQETMTVVSKSGQNVTVAARALYAIGGIAISTPATHLAAAPVNELKWPSAVFGFKTLILGAVQQVLQQYCPGHPTACPTLATQYNAVTAANGAIAAILAQVVQ